MAGGITQEQCAHIIMLLESIQAELARPRLEKEHFDAAIRESNATVERERQARQAEREQKERELASARQRCFTGQSGIPCIRDVGPDEGEAPT